MSEQGKLIALEGVLDVMLEEQSSQLYRWLFEQGVAVEQTQEPTHGPVGAQLWLIRQGRLQVDPLSQALLEVADRTDHLAREGGILSWLAEGQVVLCARYVLSSCALQWGRVGWNWIRRINARCRPPDLTLFIDVPGESVSDRRLGDHYRLAVERMRSDGEPIVWIDGQSAPSEVSIQCRHHVGQALGIE